MSENCGVYVMEFPDGSTYVGASKSIRTRIQTHLSWLRKGRGQTKALQEKYDVFGSPVCRTVLVCSSENLKMYELIVYETLDKPLCKPDGTGIAGCTVSGAARKRMSDAAKKKDQSCQSKRQLETWADPDIRERRVTAIRKYFEDRKNGKRR